MTLIDVDVRYTPEDLLQMPDGHLLELVDGQIVEKNVSIKSSRVESITASRFEVVAERDGIAQVFPQSLGYQCFPDDPGKIRRPDVTVVLSERIASLGVDDSGYMPIVPDLAVEVVSQMTSITR